MKEVPYCKLVPGQGYRIQYLNVTNPNPPAAKINSGKAIGTFVRLLIDYEFREDADDELEAMDTLGYAVFRDVQPDPSVKGNLSTGMDGFRIENMIETEEYPLSEGWHVFLVFSSDNGRGDVEVNDEIVFYEVNKIQERILHRVLSAHTQEDIAQSYSKGWFGGTSMSGRRRSQKVKAQRTRSTRRPTTMRTGGKKAVDKVKAQAKRKKTRAKRRKAALQPQIVYAQPQAPQPRIVYAQPQAPPPQIVYAQAPGPAEPMPKQGAFTWGDAAKLLAVDVAAQAIGHEVTEALEDED